MEAEVFEKGMGVEARIFPPMMKVLQESKKFAHLDCAFSECGKFANLGLCYPGTMLALAEVINECNVNPDCEVRAKGRHLPEEKTSSTKKRKKKKRLKRVKVSKLFCQECLGD